MTINDKKSNTKVVTYILSLVFTLGVSVVLSYLTMYLGENTSAAKGDMITCVYGVGTLGVGLITLAGYIGTAALFGYGIFHIIEQNEK